FLASGALATDGGDPIVNDSGFKLTDSVVLAGANNPTGTITFTLIGPNGNVVDVEIVDVNGNGTYTTPVGYMPTIAGTYQWQASYSGDTNNNNVNVSTTFGSSAVSLLSDNPNIDAVNGLTTDGVTGLYASGHVANDSSQAIFQIPLSGGGATIVTAAFN